MIRLAAALLLFAIGAAHAEAIVPFRAEVVAPRDFGYRIGDLLIQRVRLSAEGAPFEAAELPSPGRVGVWFERRPVRIEADADGVRWLRAEFQIINSPDEPRIVVLPSWELASATGGPALQVPAWRFAVAPIGSPSAIGELRPDRGPAPVPVGALKWRLQWSVAALLATLALWAGWLMWRNRRDAALRPFAGAQRRLRRLADDSPQAWRILHEAFDASAGRVLDRASLPTLFERQPALVPLRRDIERFYQQSERRFFADAEPVGGLSPRTLCRALGALEKASAE